jgi:hypothetical protein
MATPKTIVSEQFYHKTSVIRFELGSFKDVAKFKIEIAPQLHENGQPVEKRFDYDKKITMVFGFTELLRVKRMVENVLNPQRQVPKDGYAIEHFFEVSGEKKKSCLFVKRTENLGKNDAAKWEKDPYQFPFSAVLTLYSSVSNTSNSFVLSAEEAYWVMNEMPFFAWSFMEENARIIAENRAIKASGGQVPDQSAGRSQHRTPAAGADFSGEGAPSQGTPAFQDQSFDDILF